MMMTIHTLLLLLLAKRRVAFRHTTTVCSPAKICERRMRPALPQKGARAQERCPGRFSGRFARMAACAIGASCAAGRACMRCWGFAVHRKSTEASTRFCRAYSPGKAEESPVCGNCARAAPACGALIRSGGSPLLRRRFAVPAGMPAEPKPAHQRIYGQSESRIPQALLTQKAAL